MGTEITRFSEGGLEGYNSKGVHGPSILHPLGIQVLSCGSGHVEVESLETRLAALTSLALPSLD